MTKKLKNSVFKIQTIAISAMFDRQMLGVLLLGSLVLCSAIGVVYTKYLNRSLHIELQQLQDLRDKLHIEWTQLLLEQGTLGSDVRVEKVAREKLDMILPSQNQIIVIKP